MNPFTKLHIKMLVNILVVHSCILFLILASLYVFVRVTSTEESFDFLTAVIENGGEPVLFNEVPKGWIPKKPMPPPKPLFDQQASDAASLDSFYPDKHFDENIFRNFYSIKILDNGTVGKIVKDFKGNVSDKEIKQQASAVLELVKTGAMRGILHNRILWKCKVIQHGSAHLICFLDRRNELSYYNKIVYISLLVFLCSLVIAFVFAWILSSWTIKKVRRDFDRQKQFVSDAGHELRTPLAVISANLDVLADTNPNNKWIGYIKTEIIRMNDLIKKLLYLAKSDVNKQPYAMGTFDISSALTEVILPFESTVYEQGKILEIDIPNEPLPTYGDEKRIQQVAVILIDNALKNSETGALIRISLRTQKNRRVLKVFNTGVGIKPDEIEKIFERFYRSDTSRNRQTGGSGLGLAIAHAIAEAHKGSLTARSEYEKWAEVTLEIPCDKKSKDSK